MKRINETVACHKIFGTTYKITYSATKSGRGLFTAIKYEVTARGKLIATHGNLQDATSSLLQHLEHATHPAILTEHDAGFHEVAVKYCPKCKAGAL